MTTTAKGRLRRLAAATFAGAMVGAATFAVPGNAQDISGELVILNWIGGSELDMLHALEKGFTDKYPGVTIREVAVTATGDARGGIRSTLLGGEKIDVLINTWPAFRDEMVAADMLYPIDDVWAAQNLDADLGPSWKALGQTGGVTYGVQYNYGDRSGVWYRTDVLKKAGIDKPPATWDELVATFPKLKAIEVTPVSVPAKFWAHGEWFETLLLRTAGVETAAKLARHEIPWTDPAVRTTLKKFQELLNAGCCDDVNTMFGMDWDNSADQVLKAGKAGYLIIGMWVNYRAISDYGLKEGVDYSLFQFPSMGLGFDDTSSVDAKEFMLVKSGSNKAAGEAFLKYSVSAEGANIVAKFGYLTPSKNTDTSLYGPVLQTAAKAVATSNVQFVLGDLLPGDLVDEYRVQLQHFLQDPSDANIDAVLAAIEAKAKDAY